ncbi:Transposon Tn7 transposition protein TnsC [Microbulbifer sp. THAF38]|nr:Transposon Tn7 transposition protein TnsC [Microbulbifer sp. THAF38]
MRGVNYAEYNIAILPEHRGNPLIEALPKKLKDEDLVEKLSSYPSFSENERKLSAFERIEYLTRIEELRQPLPVYLECFRAIEIAIKKGYSSKNPLSPTTMNYLHYPVDQRSKVAPRTGYFKSNGSGITLLGESGVGKSCMLEQILNCFPEVIEHRKYQGEPLYIKQVVWAKVDCPENSSIRALCLKILSEIDRKLGGEETKPEKTSDLLVKQIEAKIKSSFLGVIIIDEMQHLNLAKAGGEDKFLGFLHNLMNELGVPILLCANPPFDKLLGKTLKTARRAESQASFTMDLMKNDEEWTMFVEELWVLQWTKEKTPLTKSLSDKLYDLSIGNMDLAVRIYRESQRLVIGSDNESITEYVLEYAAKKAINFSKKSVDEARINRLEKFRRIRREKSNNRSKVETSEISVKSIDTSKSEVMIIPGDLNRPQHHEFHQKLSYLQSIGDLNELIKDPDLIRRASIAENPEAELKKMEILFKNPIKHLSSK